MKSTITISAVVLLHAVGLALISGGGGCHSSSGYEDKKDNGVVFAPARPVESARGGDVARVSAINGAQDAGVVEHHGPVTPPLPPPPPVVEHRAPPPPPPVQPAEGRSYRVKSGDSLWRIAKREKITRKALAEANGLNENATLKQGQVIVIPGKGTQVPGGGSGQKKNAVSPEGTVAYVVKPGDVLGTIALRNKTSVTKIKSINNLTSDRIREGQTLYLPQAGSEISGVSANNSQTIATEKPTPVSPDAPAVPDGGFSELDRVFAETARPNEGDGISDGVPAPGN
ncbi:MAG: LysM peptidoglycan-binding domain-containing protein [Puniceicoccales bacterium]|nr:LysM peptidoglycan-binding domain-containing protein [Puniceicoccales bacterium]